MSDHTTITLIGILICLDFAGIGVLIILLLSRSRESDTTGE